jgi:uncharacterized iron-regulated membrane protein
MNGRVFSFGSSGNPLAQILSLIVFAVLLVGALIMGTFVIALLLGLAVIASAVLAVRVWWLKRKFGGRPPFEGGAEPPGAAPGTRLIEGEYEVLRKGDTDANAEDGRRSRP